MRRKAGIAALILINAVAAGAYLWSGEVPTPTLILRNSTDQTVLVRHGRGFEDAYRLDQKTYLQPGEFATIEFVKGDSFTAGFLDESAQSDPGTEAELVGEKTADFEIVEEPDGSLRFDRGIALPGEGES